MSISWWEFGIFATLYASVRWGLPKAVLKAFYVGCQRLAENNYRAALRYARFAPFVRNGHVCPHAWILIHENKLERARELLARLELEPLSPVFAAEVHFTRAAFERELGNLEPAIEHAERGLVASVRPSSERNGLFMIASIEALRGNDARAKEYFVRAVEHHYRGQGADGLLRYAEFLERTEGKAAAEAAYQLLIERDGESALATRARHRISKVAA